MAFTLFGCGGSGSSNEITESSDFAPNSIIGVTYATITSGGGEFAKTGSYLVQFKNDGTYILDGDGINVVNSSGTYIYNKDSSNGATISIVDNLLGVAVYNLQLNALGKGTYKLTASLLPDAYQIGDFEIAQ